MNQFYLKRQNFYRLRARICLTFWCLSFLNRFIYMTALISNSPKLSIRDLYSAPFNKSLYSTTQWCLVYWRSTTCVRAMHAKTMLLGYIIASLCPALCHRTAWHKVTGQVRVWIDCSISRHPIQSVPVTIIAITRNTYGCRKKL